MPVPLKRYPGFEALIHGAGLKDIADRAIPVIIIDNVAGITSPQINAQLPVINKGTVTSPQVSQTGPNGLVGTTLWVPYGEATVKAPTTFENIQLVCPDGWAIVIEELVIFVGSPTTLVGGVDLVNVIIEPGTAPTRAQESSPNQFSPRGWQWGTRSNGLVLGTNYVFGFSRKVANHGAAFVNAARWIQDATYVAPVTPVLPEFLLTKGGSLTIDIEDGGAGSHVTNLAIRAVLSWYKF